MEYLYKTEPLEHQRRAFEFACEHPEGFALFLEQGLGKTKCVIDFVENMWLRHVIDRVIVIAPNGVHRQWAEEELPKHSYAADVADVDYLVWRSSPHDAAALKRWTAKLTTDILHYLFINVEAFSCARYLPLFKEFCRSARTVVVVDESTTIGNPTAKRTKNVYDTFSNVVMNGKYVVARTPLSITRIVLTGTPMAKGPSKVYSMMDFIKVDFFGMSYFAFLNRYSLRKQQMFYSRPVRTQLTQKDIDNARAALKRGLEIEDIAVKTGISPSDLQYIKEHPNTGAYKNSEELKERLATLSLTISKEECLDLPAKTYQHRVVPMNDEQIRLYKDIVRDAYAMYEGGELDAKNQMSLSVRLRQIAGGFFPYIRDEENPEGFTEAKYKMIGTTTPKIQAMLEMLDEDASLLPCIVSTAFVAEAEEVEKALKKAGFRTGLIVGSVGFKERQAVQDAFKRGEVDILVATEQTIARGYNFQRASTMFLYSNTFSNEDRMQLEDRIHRMGQASTCLYIDLISERSIDVHVLEVLADYRKYADYMRTKDAAAFMELTGMREWA